mmetsp:Transcript_17133/g.34686  ORF Transcript_17133/g.34686 Transcript_17133/m.34686 type:complete len:86 (+) Transcript_17133:256-513(+)
MTAGDSNRRWVPPSPPPDRMLHERLASHRQERRAHSHSLPMAVCDGKRIRLAASSRNNSTSGRVGVEMSSLKLSDLTTSAKCSTI